MDLKPRPSIPDANSLPIFPRYKPDPALVTALKQQFPHLDQLMAESLVSLHDHGTLKNIEFGFSEK